MKASRKYGAKWRLKNKEKALEYARKWRELHPDYMKEYIKRKILFILETDKGMKG